MTKVTIRLSPECEVALAESEACGINNSEFIRAAILKYHSSGSWREPVELNQVEKSMPIKKEDITSDITSDGASDIMSDKASDEILADAVEDRSHQLERARGGQQISSPHLRHQQSCAQTVCRDGMNLLELALILVVVATTIHLAFRLLMEISDRLN